MKYLVTIIGEAKRGGVLHTNLYYTTKKKLETQDHIEEMRDKIKNSVEELDPDKGVVIGNIFGPLKK